MISARGHCGEECSRATAAFLRAIIRFLMHFGWGWTLVALGICLGVWTVLEFWDVIADWFDK